MTEQQIDTEHEARAIARAKGYRIERDKRSADLLAFDPLTGRTHVAAPTWEQLLADLRAAAPLGDARARLAADLALFRAELQRRRERDDARRKILW